MRTNICGFLLTPLREGRPDASLAPELFTRLFLLTPLREGRHDLQSRITTMNRISTHAPAGGATRYGANSADSWFLFLLTPLREGRQYASNGKGNLGVFLLTPLREGRPKMAVTIADEEGFLLTPLREGRRSADQPWISHRSFLLTPLREGRPVKTVFIRVLVNFYSRPCGRGDSVRGKTVLPFSAFLLTPLREGRRLALIIACAAGAISTHAPAGGATRRQQGSHTVRSISTHAPAGGATEPVRQALFSFRFLLTPLREGRRGTGRELLERRYFYSRPCGRGDSRAEALCRQSTPFLLTPLREGRQQFSTSPS